MPRCSHESADHRRKGQLGTTLTQTAPGAIEYLSLDLPEIDITDAKAVDAVVGDEKPDVIINASAYTAVDRAEEELTLPLLSTRPDPETLPGWQESRRAPDSCVNGLRVRWNRCTPYPPEAPCSPLGVYGKSKRQGEINVLDVIDDPVIIRTSWLYSQYGNNFVLTMLRLMNERDELKVVAAQVGGPTWAWTLAAAIWAVAGKTNLKGIYHWSDAGVTSWYDFAVAIQEEALVRGLIETDPHPPHYDRRVPHADNPTGLQRAELQRLLA